MNLRLSLHQKRFLTLDNLDRHLLICFCIHSLNDLAKTSFADSFLYDVSVVDCFTHREDIVVVVIVPAVVVGSGSWRWLWLLGGSGAGDGGGFLGCSGGSTGFTFFVVDLSERTINEVFFGRGMEIRNGMSDEMDI